MGDFGIETEQFIAVSDILAKSIERDGMTYIHCTAGVGRSPTSIILYLCRFHSMSIDDALELIKKKRPQVLPKLLTLEKCITSLKS